MIGEQVLFAVAQLPFEDGKGNRFCTLVPLATGAGEPIDPISEFLNRGLCWWMARRTFPLGRVVVAKVEEARQEAGDDPDRDAYQAVVESVTEAGPKTFIEIVEGGHLDPRELLNLDSGVECDHPATGLVLVRLGASLYGPFTAESTKVDWKRWSLKLQRPASNQYVLRFDDRALSGKKGHVLVERTISLQDRPPAKSDERVTCRYEGVVWAQYKIMETSAERLSLRSDEEVLSSLARAIGLSKKRRREALELLKELRDAIAAAGPEIEDEATELLTTLEKGQSRVLGALKSTSLERWHSERPR
jgi:hypothetical protein